MRALVLFVIGIGLWGLQSLSGQVVINEVMVGPPANPNATGINAGSNANSLYNIDATSQPPYNREYIELYNMHPCDSIDISCFTLASNASNPGMPDNWGAFTFPQGSVIPPLGFIIVGGNDANGGIIDFNTTQYRQTSFNTQHLTGDIVRWFLRDQWGWIALYDPTGLPVNAVYWNAAPGNAASLFTENEYQNNVINTLGCNGLTVLNAASSITGIEYVGNVIPASMTSFQRVQDGSPNWHPGPVTPTTRGPNGAPIAPPSLSFTVTPDYCGVQNGTITVHITSGGTPPYTIYWNGNTSPGGAVLSNLAAGTYTIEVRDAYDCLFTLDTVVVGSEPGPVIDVVSLVNETCSNSNGSILINPIGGMAPFSYAWNTTPATNTGSLYNISEGTYVVTVTDNAGCEAIDTIEVINHREPIVNTQLLSPDSCSYGVGIALAMASGDYHPYQYLWSSIPTQTDSIATQLPSGNYTITVTDGVCTTLANIFVPLIPPPVANFSATPNPVYVEDGVVQFTDLSPGPVTEWLWDFQDGNTSTQQNPSHRFTSLGTFNVNLTVTDQIGCKGSVEKPIVVKGISAVFFPNAFSPNGDGQNDLFKPVGSSLYNYTLTIYDRWGRVLFVSNDPDQGWDGSSLQGKPLPDGVYVWLAAFTHDYGDNIQKDLHLRGTVTLVR